MDTAPKLIYAYAHDEPAASVIDYLAFRFQTRSKNVAFELRESGLDLWICDGKLAVGDECWPVSIAMIRPENDVDKYLAGTLGFDRANRLRVIGGATSKNRDGSGLTRFIEGNGGECHLRDLVRYPFDGYERVVANQILESFVMNRFLRRPRPYRRSLSNSRLQRLGCYFVEGPPLEEALLEGAAG